MPVEQLFDAFLEQGELRERTSTRPKSARFDWAGGESRVNATFVAKGEASSTVPSSTVGWPIRTRPSA